MLSSNKVDREAHDEYYSGRQSALGDAASKGDYIAQYEAENLEPFCLGGSTKGYVRGLATRSLFEAAVRSRRDLGDITILDAGCGPGELSTYLACRGARVIGVDISPVACEIASELAAKIGVSDRCQFLANDLGKMDIADGAVDYILGHASLHHFIKYDHVPAEFARVLRKGGEGFFADSFGENKIYRLFHDKAKMQRLGDVSLTKPMIEAYFAPYFDVTLRPTDWFAMLDKLYLKLFPRKLDGALRKLSKMHHWLDQCVPTASRTALYLSGAVMTHITRR